MRLAVYTDYSYRRESGHVFGERAFVLFLARLAPAMERMVLLGRLSREPGKTRYRLPGEIEFVPLPHYASAAHPRAAASAMVRSLGRFWRALEDVDAVWLLGPHPLSLAFAVLARARRRRVVLGVRQDYPAYARSRHPGRRWIHLAALALELASRAMALRHPLVVVGPALARRYRRARNVLVISVSLVGERDIVSTAGERSWDGELRVLSVGRLEAEKNPLLLADVLARLRERDDRWRLVVCGEGPMREQLERRLHELGVADRAELRGYVPIDRGLLDIYRQCHAFLHVSWTEGLPQVLFEAFAARLPVVATAVGGVAEAAGDAALLVPSGDPDAATAALFRLAGDESLRARLVEGGVARVRRHTVESECRRVVEFLQAGAAALPAKARRPG